MKVKRVLYFVSIFLMFYVIYVGFYQWIVNKGNYLTDQHCINVNPLIIDRKNAYIDSMKSLILLNDNEKYAEYTDNYIKFTNDYIDSEKEWLEDNYDFINKWYVKLFVDKNTQDALWLDYKMYERDMNGSIIIISILNDLNEKNGQNQEKLLLKLSKNVDEYQKLEKQIEQKRQLSLKIFKNNIRSRLLQIPLSKCPAENNNIPDVEKELNKFIKSSDFEFAPYPWIIG